MSQPAALLALAPPLDLGEAAALVLAEELAADVVLLDDKRARAVAARRGLQFTGTVGILRDARDRGLVRAAYPLIIQLRALGFWISDAVITRVGAEEQAP